MKLNNRGRSPLGGLIVAVILVASTAGYVSAFSRMFQATLSLDRPEASEELSVPDETRPAAAEAAAPDQAFTRSAPAWLTNALPNYSARAREMWYLSLMNSRENVTFEPAYVGTLRDRYNADVASFSSPMFRSMPGGSSVLSLSAPQSAAPDLYWRTDGTTGLTWTGGTNWSNPASPTGGSAWVSGDDAFFTANSTLTFATTAVSDVTVSPGITVTVTAAGTLTLGGVRTFDIGAGSTLTWTSQAQSTAAANEGAGIIKNGDGTLNWGAGPGNNVRFDGGFTLNAGTVIVSGGSAFGTAGVLPATLTINGGTITVNFNNNADRTFANPVSLNGDVILGHTGASTGNAIWSGNVALSVGNHTITNNAPTTSTRNFSGAVSGTNSSLTFAGTGITVLSGANTYDGGTTVNSGTLLANSGSGNSSTGSGFVTVNNTGTLGGTGFINSGANNITVNSSGNITGGTKGTVGTLTLTANTLVIAGTNLVDINGATADRITLTGNLNITGGTIDFNTASAPTAPTYTLLSYTGTLTGTFTIVDLPAGYDLIYNTGSIDLVAVPEMSTWISAALALGVIGFTQRRKVRTALAALL